MRKELVRRDVPPSLQHGFPVETHGKVPAIGEQGISTQTFCPLIQDDCRGARCMFWVELLTSTGPEARRVAHCAYYWNTIQLVDIKQALLRLDEKVKVVMEKENAISKP